MCAHQEEHNANSYSAYLTPPQNPTSLQRRTRTYMAHALLLVMRISTRTAISCLDSAMNVAPWLYEQRDKRQQLKQSYFEKNVDAKYPAR
jgi:hypothetical protein